MDTLPLQSNKAAVTHRTNDDDKHLAETKSDESHHSLKLTQASKFQISHAFILVFHIQHL